MASRTATASRTVRQWIPDRSPACLLPMPPSIRMPLVVSRLTMLFLEAGPLQDAEPCSHTEHVTRFAETETPEPPLVPRGSRDVSYGLQAWPPHCPYLRLPKGIIVFAFAAPFPPGPPTLSAFATAKMIAPFERRSAISDESTLGLSLIHI